MGEPASLADAVHDTVIVALVAIVDTSVGELGVSTGVTVGADDGVEPPTEFVATTEKV
jgi:hypothetical protein